MSTEKPSMSSGLGPEPVFEDRFEIQHLAGEGGMGAVYAAWDRASNRRIALKILSSKKPSDELRFEREVSLLRATRHPGIVEYIDHGRNAAGQLFLAMEWLAGEDLGARLTRGPLAEGEVLRLGVQLADALAAAHVLGIVHRDLKPANIFLVEGDIDRAKIIDFGVAREGAVGRLTVTGNAVGTANYMAPEQARGDRELLPAADLHGLGATLFECLTGRPPFEGAHFVAILAKVIVEEAPRVIDLVPGIDPRLSAIVARMLAKTPSIRPQNGAEAAALLRAQSASVSVSLSSRAVGSSLYDELRLLSVLVAVRDAHGVDPSMAPTIAPGEALPPLARLREVVAAHGGVLEVLANGALLVTQENGVALDRAASLARCALAMRGVIPEMAIGIAMGRARVSQRVSAGEAIDRAVALLEGGAGSVRVDATTLSLLGPRFLLASEASGELTLIGEADGDPEIRRVRGRPSPCVGRDRELGLLLGVLDESVDEGSPRAVLVTGGAGMGKSRVRHEFLTRVASAYPAAQVWLGRGDPMRAGAPFAMIEDALRRGLGLPASDATDAPWQRLSARVARHVGEDAPRVAAFLAELLDVAPHSEPSPAVRAAREEPVLLGDQMVRAALDLITAEALAAPLVLVLDDLQWGDLPSVRLIDAALRRVDAPLLVLGLARPEVDAVFPRLFRDRGVVDVSLGPLGKRAAGELVASVLGKSDPSLVASILERGAGNAFYLEELARAGAEGHGDLPDTVLSMAEARLEVLSPEQRRLLRAASVFGRVSTPGGIAALVGAPWTTENVAPALADLVDAELVERRRGGGGEEIVFRHSILRDAAYAMLSADDRREAHAAAAAWLEGTSQADATLLAEHLGRAGLAHEAVQHLLRAAEQALAGHDFDKVLVLAKRTADADPPRVILGHVRLLEAEAERWLGNFDDAEEAALQAVAMLPGGSAAWFRAVEEVISASGRRGEYGLALDWEREALGAPIEEGATDATLSCLCAAGRSLFHAGLYAEADGLLVRVQALAAAESPGPRVRAEVERLAGARARHLGDVGLALLHYGHALAAFEEADDIRNAGNARVSYAFGNIEVGLWDVARRELDRALVEADRTGITVVAARARQNLGLVLLHDGEIEAAIASLDQAIEQARAHGNVRFEGWTLVYRSVARRMAKRAADAEADARRSLDLLAVSPPARAGALAALTFAILDRGAAGEAMKAAAEARSILDEYGGVEEFEPLILLAHVRALQASGEATRAREAAVDARRRVLARAVRISDPVIRESFLSRVPENALLLELGAHDA